MNESYEITETYVGFPTEFELLISDNLGFAENVLLHLPTEKNPLYLCYMEKVVINNMIYSVFKVFYTFKEKCEQGIAYFSFEVNGRMYKSELHYKVIP